MAQNSREEVQTTMTSQAKTSLCFVSWNTRGVKKLFKRTARYLVFFEILNNLNADIVFMQETHIGSNCYHIFERFEGWKAYFTVHSPRSKGVAILIRDTVLFEYICHDEDFSGGYIVLSCYLYGERYTLVSVYNHHKDKIVLNRLKDYLTERTEGVLVVGGDFNTVLDPSVDRRPASSKNSPLKVVLENFTTSLEIVDTWSRIHPGNDTEQRFTRQQGERSSRIDMFFLKTEEIDRRLQSISVNNDLVQGRTLSDHYPLVLELQIQTEEIHTDTKRLNTCEDNSDRSPGMISGGEIVSAIKSLCNREKHRFGMNDETHYITACCTLKTKYNDILKTLEVPENFRGSGDIFNKEYYIFLEILVKRLSFYISHEHYNCGDVKFKSPQTIKWSHLQITFEKLDRNYKHKGSKQAPFAPPPDFRILDRLLPKVQGGSDLRNLHPDCPLTNAILNLAREQLDVMFYTTDHRTRRYKKDRLPANKQLPKHKQIVRQTFQDDSGLILLK